jgi:hypothetical protein
MEHRRPPRLDVAPILEAGPRLRSFRAYLLVVDGVRPLPAARVCSADITWTLQEELRPKCHRHRTHTSWSCTLHHGKETTVFNAAVEDPKTSSEGSRMDFGVSQER